jgi:hypothetical protein
VSEASNNQSPTIFVAHSMGGLVVKKVLRHSTALTFQAIIDAFIDSRTSRICENTKSVIFMGTPHRGTNLASILGNLIGIIGMKRVFIDQLKSNCETITEINRLFQARAKTMSLVSFYESTGTGRLGVSFGLLLRLIADNCPQRFCNSWSPG